MNSSRLTGAQCKDAQNTDESLSCSPGQPVQNAGDMSQQTLEDSQAYADTVLSTQTTTAIGSPAAQQGYSQIQSHSPSLLRADKRRVQRPSEKIDILGIAAEYVESALSSGLNAVLRTPLSSNFRRKRQLSIPDESAIKKVRSDNSESRQILRAKRYLYEGELAGKSDDDTISNDECIETNNSGASGKQNKGRKKKQKGNDSAGEKLVTSAEVHVDADLSSMDTRELLMTLISQTQQNFDIMGRRMESLETNLEKKLTDKMNKAIDRRINTETNKFKKEIDKNVSDLRKEIDNEIEDITEKVNRVTHQIEQLDGVRVARPEKEDIKLNIVVRKLPETSRKKLNN